MMAPIDVPPTKSASMPASSKAFMTPTWAKPRAPPPRQYEADTVARYDPRQPAHVARKFRPDVEMPRDAPVFQPLRGAGRAFGLEAVQKDERLPRDRDRRLARETVAFHA
ncbi:hypothetical protein [Bradyrhizobium sp. NAS80.1]|uniref:hypothetical protein n=1 Tax=Bradyrhizobium sp. NAS80.1 TaxID=1680159 RepID=UPI001FD9D24F|nr:hypothetical protein [Bradyrhizobium sp. NAS80.1]